MAKKLTNIIEKEGNTLNFRVLKTKYTATMNQQDPTATIKRNCVTMLSYRKGYFIATKRSVLITVKCKTDTRQRQSIVICSMLNNLQNKNDDPPPFRMIISSAMNAGCAPIPTSRSVTAKQASRMLYVV